MDIGDTLAPTSDQLDAIDLIDGPRIFTIEKVTRNNDDQPINVHLREFPRPWRPSKGMRRVLAHCWSRDSSVWAGRRVELYRDPNVTFGKEKPGGTRISKLSHIDKPIDVPMLTGRGKAGTWKVQPLPDAPPAPDYAAQVAAAASTDDLNVIWRDAGTRGHLTAELRDSIIARGAEFDESTGGERS